MLFKKKKRFHSEIFHKYIYFNFLPFSVTSFPSTSTIQKTARDYITSYNGLTNYADILEAGDMN